MSQSEQLFTLPDVQQSRSEWRRIALEREKERDEARDGLRRHLAGQLLPADKYPWLDEEQP